MLDKLSLDDLVFGKNKLCESGKLPSELVNLQSEGIWFYSGENGNIRCMYELPKDHVLYQEGVSSGIRERNFITLAVISREGNSVRLGVPGRQIILNMAPKEVIDISPGECPMWFRIVPGKFTWKQIDSSAVAETVSKVCRHAKEHFEAISGTKLLRRVISLVPSVVEQVFRWDLGPDLVFERCVLPLARVNGNPAHACRYVVGKHRFYIITIGTTVMYYIHGLTGIRYTSINTKYYGYLEPAKCDLIRRFFEFCRHEGKFDHFNNAARDLLFDAFVVHWLNVKVKDGSDEIRFGGRKESYPELFLSNNSDRLYNWFVVCGTDIKRVVYGHERRYLNWKHIFVSDHTRKLSKDVLDLVDTALIEVENQRLDEERLNKETKDGN
jgi:hypothetical protein